MKPTRLNILPILLLQVSIQILEEVAEIWSQWRKQKLPLYLFLAMCFNLVVAPVVYAFELQLPALEKVHRQCRRHLMPTQTKNRFFCLTPVTSLGIDSLIIVDQQAYNQAETGRLAI